MEATSNNVSEVLEGVTLEVKDLGSVQVTVEPDKAANEGKPGRICQHVQRSIPSQGIESDRRHGLLEYTGDSTIKRLKLAMQTGVTGIVPGTTGSWSALSEMGIEMDATGKLEIVRTSWTMHSTRTSRESPTSLPSTTWESVIAW